MDVHDLPARSRSLAAMTGLALALAAAGCGTARQGGMAGTDSPRSSAAGDSRTGSAASSEDERLSARVKERLTRAGVHEGVRVTVNDGTVTLSGTTVSQGDKLNADMVARTTTGVQAVENNILVRLP